MSLETVLKIGKVLRNSENSLKYFKYVESCPKDKDDKRTICITVPVKEDFSFDWERMKMTPPVKKDKLFYLNFTTSNSDTSPKKYGWGDIFYSRLSKLNKEGKVKYNEFGNYTFNKDSNAFYNGEATFDNIRIDYIKKALSPSIEIKDLVEKELVIKIALLQINQKRKGSEVKPTPKNILKYQSQIDYFIQKANEIENSFSMFLFQKKFKEQIMKFDNLLKYAPAIEYLILENSLEIEEILNDTIKAKENYCKVILKNEFEKVKRLLDKGEKIDTISNDSLKRIEQYANFRVFIHFDFKGKEGWYNFENEFDLIKNRLNSEITDCYKINDINSQDKNVIVPSKNIFRTLCSGNDKNDYQFPQFNLDYRHKSFTFRNDDQFLDFLYTDRIILKNPLRRIDGTDIGIYVLPVSIDNDHEISPKEYELFFFDKKDETRFSEPVFSFERDLTQFKRFDFIFTDTGGNTEYDRIEISGIEKSRFFEIKKRIEDISLKLTAEKKQILGLSDIKNLRIESSFTNLLGKAEIEVNQKSKKVKVVFKNMTKTSSGLKPVPQYQSHLLKVLPLIYTEHYYNDEVLLPELIRKVEFSLRSGDEWGNYTLLKFDFKFLLLIQNNNSKIDKYMEITDSSSYQIGIRLGKLSKPLKKKINSFEKKYVGLLTRHISTKDDCIKFSNEINEMLVRHEKTWGQMSAETIEQIVSLPYKEYDKEKLALGFFEGYFKYEVTDDKKSLITKIEKLISDYDEVENLQNEIQQLRETLEEIK